MEEVNTLLREVETAAQRRLLVIGTTNRLDAIDRALLRRGRFDLVFTMDYPDAAAAAAMLQALLDERPHATGMDVAAIGSAWPGVRPATWPGWWTRRRGWQCAPGGTRSTSCYWPVPLPNWPRSEGTRLWASSRHGPRVQRASRPGAARARPPGSRARAAWSSVGVLMFGGMLAFVLVFFPPGSGDRLAG